MQVVLPEYVTDKSWRAMADSLLVTMMGQGSVVAGLRRSELCYVDQLLAPLLPCTTTAMEEDEAAMTLIDASQSPVLSQKYQTDAPHSWDLIIDTDLMNPDPNQLLDLAFQFGIQSETDIIGQL